MSFVLVGYPVVAPNYLHHDPLDQPPHPILAQILRTVAASNHQAQIATFMASGNDIGQFNYFNHTYMNGHVEADVMEAAEFQAASIMTAAAEQGSFEPYMSFGYRDDCDSITYGSLEAPPIEKLNNPRYDYYDEDDCVSDVDKAVQQQVDQHEAVCSSSSYYSPSLIEEDRNRKYDPHSMVDVYFQKTVSAADMPITKYADVVAKIETVTQQCLPIWDRSSAVPECTNDGPCCNNEALSIPLQEQFPELPKRDLHVRKQAPPKLPIDYAAIVKRNVSQSPNTTMPVYANQSPKDQLLYTPAQSRFNKKNETVYQYTMLNNPNQSLQTNTTLCPQEEHMTGSNITSNSEICSAVERQDDTKSAVRQVMKFNIMPNYADVVKGSPNQADISKRKACSPPGHAPSKKLMKQENLSLTMQTEKSQDPVALQSVTNNDDMVILQSQIGYRDQASGPETATTVPHPADAEQLGLYKKLVQCKSLAQCKSSKLQTVTPYAEIVRRNAEKGHSSNNDKGGSPSCPKLLAPFDRLEQLLVRPARIPWVQTGDPLMHLYQKERKQANEYGYNMNECFKLSQKYYHAKDWVNAKRYSNEGHRFRQRMHRLHTQASRRIFEQRNQQDALFIDLHGIHVDEAQANIYRWFRELKDHRGIVYIVTGTGHHSRTGATKKESRLRPAVHAFLCNMYRCEETSVLGDDKGGVFAVYLCPHRFNPTTSYCVHCKFRPIK